MGDGLKKRRFAGISFFGVAGICLLYGLWTGSLLDSDDVIYADIARTMWDTGAFLEIRWHEALLFEKPPVLFWVLSLFGGLFGFGDFALRAPGALSALGILLVLVPFAGSLGLNKRYSLLPAAILLSAYTFVFHARRVLADPLFVLAMYSFVLLWVRTCDSEERSRSQESLKLGLFSGICLGVCVMIKWAFVLLPLVLVGSWHVLEKRRVFWKPLFWAAFSGMFVVIPWHAYQHFVYGFRFWDVYAGYHVVERATRSLVSPTGAGFYLDLLLETDPVFFVLLALGLMGSLLSWISGNLRALNPWLMAFLAFLPLQLAGTKMPHYLFSVVPMAAVAAAFGWEQLFLRFRFKGLVLGLGCLLFLSFVSGPLPQVLNPDYSPTVKRACELAADEEYPVLVVNAYSPAATWYCDKAVKMHTDDPRFYEVQQSIDMMARSGAVSKLETAELIELISKNPKSPVITRRGHGLSLRERLPKEQEGRAVRSLGEADLLLPSGIILPLEP